MCIFGKKTVKISAAPGGSAPEPAFAFGSWGLRLQTPALLLPFAITTLSSSLSTFVSFALLAFVFHFKLHVDFFDGGARIFLASGRRVP